jgi:MFS family permease
MDRQLLVLALGSFAIGTDRFVVAGVLPEIMRSFHVGIGAAGQVTTIFALTFAVLAPTIDREPGNGCCADLRYRPGDESPRWSGCGYVFPDGRRLRDRHCAA